MAQFNVKLLPSGHRATVEADTVVLAAATVRDATGTPANEALVLPATPLSESWVNPSPHRPTRVIFGREAAVHFVGFPDEFGRTFQNAVAMWGMPDFVHRGWDARARREIGEGDLLVFARGTPDDEPHRHTFDDSNEPHDPANAERIEMNRERSRAGQRRA